MGKLDGKVAIVTGSGQGIGRGIAIGLAREGAKLITNNRKPGSLSVQQRSKSSIPDEDWIEMMKLSGDAESTAEMIRLEGGEAIPFYGDVSDKETADQLVKLAIDTWGRIDIIVNNAAGTGTGSIMDLDDETWDKLTTAKMKGAFHVTQAAVPYMIAQKYGRIFNCASDAWVGLPGNDAYSAGNAGAVGLTWASAMELYNYNITVNAYCPQGKSPSHAIEYRKLLREMKELTGKEPDSALLKKVEDDHGDPVNLTPFFTYLCSDEAHEISGEVFGIKSSGKVELYSYPQLISSMEYSIDEDYEQFAKSFKGRLLGENHISPAAHSVWGAAK